MRELSVTEFKARLSWVLKEVQRGKRFIIFYGRERRPVAKIVLVKKGDETKQT